MEPAAKRQGDADAPEAAGASIDQFDPAVEELDVEPRDLRGEIDRARSLHWTVWRARYAARTTSLGGAAMKEHSPRRTQRKSSPLWLVLAMMAWPVTAAAQTPTVRADQDVQGRKGWVLENGKV